MNDPLAGIEWRRSALPIDYMAAVAEMEERVAAIRDHGAAELIWLLEHPPLYTAGTSADPAELLDPDRFPVFSSGRGGRYTYHGPGQRVGYVLLDLDKRGRDIRRFVAGLERWIIAVLADFGVEARQEPGRIGIWTGSGAQEAKIAAIGVRVRRWVTLHGFSINVEPDLGHFSSIIPCGLERYGVTSLADLGVENALDQVDAGLKKHCPEFLQRISGEIPCR